MYQDGGRIVVYRGNPQARLMLIGEAPGADEDKLGAPFVGRSGQLLDDILKAVGVDPEHDIYVRQVLHSNGRRGTWLVIRMFYA